ncbi:hypothetical protein ACKI2N_026515 [Cupriavidus sp. 30B13]
MAARHGPARDEARPGKAVHEVVHESTGTELLADQGKPDRLVTVA